MEDRQQDLQREVIIKVLWSVKVFVPLQRSYKAIADKLYIVDDQDNEIPIGFD
jgi:hypothetical protein